MRDRLVPVPCRIRTGSCPRRQCPRRQQRVPGGRGEQIGAAIQPGSTRPVYISLPSHIFGLGGRMSASTPGFGVTARKWWGNRLGFQFEASRYRLESVTAPGHVTSFQFAPSVLYSLPDGVSNSLWVRPYLGGGGSMYRATLSVGTSGLEDAVDKALGLQAFGGAEATVFRRAAIRTQRGCRLSVVADNVRRIRAAQNRLLTGGPLVLQIAIRTLCITTEEWQAIAQKWPHGCFVIRTSESCRLPFSGAQQRR